MHVDVVDRLLAAFFPWVATTRVPILVHACAPRPMSACRYHREVPAAESMGAVPCVRLDATCEVSIDASRRWELAFRPYVHMEPWTVRIAVAKITHSLIGTAYHPHTIDMFGWRDISYI